MECQRSQKQEFSLLFLQAELSYGSKIRVVLTLCGRGGGEEGKAEAPVMLYFFIFMQVTQLCLVGEHVLSSHACVFYFN